LAGCNEGKADPKAEAPPPANVQADLDANNFKADHPEQFPLATAVEYKAAPSLNVTGVVQPDIARSVPVIFGGGGTRGGGESAAGRHRKKRPAAPEGTEQRCCRRLPDLPQGAERRTAGAIESAAANDSL